MQWQLGNAPDRSLTVLVKACFGLLCHAFVGPGPASRVHPVERLYLFLDDEHDAVPMICSRGTCFVPYAFCPESGRDDRRSSNLDQVLLNGPGRLGDGAFFCRHRVDLHI